MGCELDQLLVAAWGRVGAKILGEEGELEARLARRRSRMFERMPRALCLAVRACDHRITPMNAIVCPGHAVERGWEAEHEVVLDYRLVQDLCRPVHIEWPGESAKSVMKRMGCDCAGLMSLRRSGFVSVRAQPGVGGRRGSPLLYTEKPLDPTAFGKEPPDPLMVALWAELVGRLDPEMVGQALVRRPVYVRGTKRRIGWRWVCPGCKKEVRTVYYPMGPGDWAKVHGIKLPAAAWDELPERPGCFACERCHGVMGFTRTSEGAMRRSWNHIVLHVSGALLYGKEVERPGWLTIERKRRYSARRRGVSEGTA